MSGCEALTISKQLKKETRGKRNVFYKSQETAKKSIKTVLREADTTRSIINRIHKPLFWPCDEETETRTSCDNWND